MGTKPQGTQSRVCLIKVKEGFLEETLELNLEGGK